VVLSLIEISVEKNKVQILLTTMTAQCLNSIDSQQTDSDGTLVTVHWTWTEMQQITVAAVFYTQLTGRP